MTDREKTMVEMHGEICSRREAMKILKCGFVKLTELIEYGSILTACDGVFIDVRSVARYIESGQKPAKRQWV